MKKNYTIVFAVIAALIALCAFWGCSSSDDDDSPYSPPLPPAEEAGLGDVEITVAAGEQVYNADGTTPYTFAPGAAKVVWVANSDIGSNYNTAVAALSSIDSNGKLTLKLPVFSFWADADVKVWHTEVGLTAVPSDVQTAQVSTLKFGSSLGITENMLRKTNADGTSEVYYVYADKDAEIHDETSPDEEGKTGRVDLILKKGWNLAIGYNAPDGSISLTSGDPGPAFRWEVYDID
jgi:hypothetical protein